MVHPRKGILFLVVGPSGSGKDTLINSARKHFSGEPNLLFPRRIITRPADSGGEDHREISLEAFETLESNGGFALSWRAYGLAYGIPANIEDSLYAGTSIIVNVSRSVIEEARAKFSRVHVLNVTVDKNILRRRLAARGRESAQDIEQRVARADAYDPPGGAVTDINNSAANDGAINQFHQAIANQLGT